MLFYYYHRHFGAKNDPSIGMNGYETFNSLFEANMGQ